MRNLPVSASFVLSVLAAGAAAAQQEAAAPSASDTEAVAKAVANPISSLISLPFQNNVDCCYGSSNVAFYTLNIQPVVPLSLSTDWNVIVRTIVPVLNRPSTRPGVPSDFGLGDVTQSFFFSPKAPVAGLIVGAGPVIVYPVGSALLGSQKWSAGPTFVVLKQQGGWTAGLLANQVWSFANTPSGGSSSRANVSALFLQPFLSYTQRDTTSYTLSTESSYNWTAHAWNAPVIVTVGKIFRFGSQLVQLSGAGKIYAAAPGARGTGWGARVNATFLFPRR